MTRQITRLAVPAAAAGLAGLVLTGCGEQPAGTDLVIVDGQLFQVTATVLESPEHGPQLCPAVAESYPPQCGGPELIGWDWDTVDSESASGTTWGSYLLTGTWDGSRFTLTRPPEPDDGRSSGEPEEPELTSPCAEPAGGWQPVEPATATQAALESALGRAAADPGYAGSWIDQSYLDQLGELDQSELERLANDPARLVLNLRFTGDPAQREPAIRQVWGGALCLSGAEHTEAELVGLQQRLHEDLPDTVLSSGVDPLANAVVAQVFVADPGLQRELDQRYGGGAVILDGWLRPLS
jgi:hypothetical protein